MSGRLTRRDWVRASKAQVAGFEALEHRVLLAADLTAVFVSITPAPPLPSGAAIVARLSVGNIGDAAAKGSSRVDFFISQDDQLDVGDAAVTSVKLSGTFNPNLEVLKDFKLTIPTSTDAGNWRLIAVLNADQKLVGENAANNTIVSEAFEVTQPDYDLSAVFGQVKLPPALVFDAGGKGTAKLVLTNNGTAPLAKKQSVVVHVVLRPVDAVDDSQDVLISPPDAKPFTINNLKAGANKQITVKLLLAGSAAPRGDYDLVALLDVNDGLAETNENNNSATAGAPGTVIVADPFVDLETAIVSPTLPLAVVAGSATKIQLPTQVTNHGNVPLVSGQLVDIRVSARLADAVDDSGDVLVADFTAQKFSGLKPEAIKKLKLSFTLPVNLPEGDYVLVVKVDPADALDESNEDNNDAQTSGDQAITVADAFVDLQLSAASTTLAATTAAKTKGKGNITLVNAGNVPAAGKVKIEFFATQNGTIEGDSPRIGVLDNVSLSLKPNTSKALSVDVTAPDVNGDTPLQIVARVTTLEGIVESDAGNNTRAAGNVTFTEVPTFLVALGDTITFTQTNFQVGNNGFGSGTTETGTWVDSKGNTGGFILTYFTTNISGPQNKIGTILITKNGGGFVNLSLVMTFKNRPLQVGGLSIAFAASGSNDGSMVASYSAGPFGSKDGVFDIL